MLRTVHIVHAGGKFFVIATALLVCSGMVAECLMVGSKRAAS